MVWGGECLSRASQGHRGKEWPTRNSSPQSGGREPIKGRPEAICVSPADLCRHRVLNLNLWDQWCALRGWSSQVGFFSHFPKDGTLKHSEAQILSATASFQSQILQNTVMRGSSYLFWKWTHILMVLSQLCPAHWTRILEEVKLSVMQLTMSPFLFSKHKHIVSDKDHMMTAVFLLRTELP